jgi:peptidoglycan/LPS O-acetylase OafA/YrhL
MLPAGIIGFAHVGVAWSLTLEVELYALYTAVATRIRSIGPIRLLWITLGISVASRLLLLVFGLHGSSHIRTADFALGTTENGPAVWAQLLWIAAPTRMFEWTLGLVAAEAYFGNIELPRWMSSAVTAFVGVAGGYLIWRVDKRISVDIYDMFLDLVLAMGFVAALLALIRYETERSIVRTLLRPLAEVGIFSYSLYLVHVPVMSALRKYLHPRHLGPTELVVVCIAASIAVAFVFHLIVERRFLGGTAPSRAARAQSPSRA